LFSAPEAFTWENERTGRSGLERDDLFTVGVFVLRLVGVVRWSLFVRCRAVAIAGDDA